MVSRKDSNIQRLKRHKRVRAKISGTEARPRLCVYRSLNNISAQIIDDVKGVTLAAATSQEKSFGGNGGNKEAAKQVGKLIAERAAAKGITAADTFTTVVYWSLRKAQEKADSSSESGKTEARDIYCLSLWLRPVYTRFE